MISSVIVNALIVLLFSQNVRSPRLYTGKAQKNVVHNIMFIADVSEHAPIGPAFHAIAVNEKM